MRTCITFVCIILMVTTAFAQEFSWQGHRGCRGLLPENSIAAFLKALEYPEVRTLEMDVVLSGDGKVVVSHEAWMSREICSHPDGRAVEKEEEKSLNLYKMTLEEIKKFDCGKRGHERFRMQQPMPAFKPQLSEVVEALRRSAFDFPKLNIELKTEGAKFDEIFQPAPAKFVATVLAEIRRLKIEDMVSLQSFDVRVLREIKANSDRIPISLLVENLRGFSWNIKRLGFEPDTYSCHYKLVNKRLVEKCHSRGIKIVPWTVNEAAEIEKLIAMGVDGIITDYPNLAYKVNK